MTPLERLGWILFEPLKKADEVLRRSDDAGLEVQSKDEDIPGVWGAEAAGRLPTDASQGSRTRLSYSRASL